MEVDDLDMQINGETKNKLVGDVNYNEAEKNASAITPVPDFAGRKIT